LTSRKGLSVPSATLSVRIPTEKDRADLAFGIEQGVDIVAMSFVRRPDDVREARELMHAHNADLPIIAKIEQHEALECFEEIVAESDGIMVARGDLGVEIPIEKVPAVQKMLIRTANRAGKPVITATQMLKSMVESPRPTRAEATDVANAILDGTDAVMLSEETAAGRHPVAAVRMMEAIARETEASADFAVFLQSEREASRDMASTDAITQSACRIARMIGARVIVTPTMSGTTARLVSRHRPAQAVLGLSPDQQTVRSLCLSWGVTPCLAPEFGSADDMIRAAAEAALATGLARPGDVAVITAGLPAASRGTTNLIKVEALREQ